MTRATPPSAESTDAAVGITVRIPGPLREMTDGRAEIGMEAGTVGEALERLVAWYPRLRRHLRDEGGALRDHVNVFVNEDDARYAGGDAAKLSPADVVTVVPSIAGG